MSAAEVLHERVAGGDPCGGPQAFEPAHRAEPGLQPSMIGFYRVVGVLLGDVRGCWDQVVEDPQVGPALSVVTSTGVGP